jgi:hypothetical protein
MQNDFIITSPGQKTPSNLRAKVTRDHWQVRTV